MKFKYILILTAFIAIGLSGSLLAQSNSMTVEWQDSQGNLVVNALYNAVMGDTVAGGARANADRIYVLKKGGYYWNTSTITNNGWTLRLVGETPGNTFEEAPPVVQMVLSSTGAAPGKILNVSGDLVMKNLYFIGSDDQGVQTYYEPITFNANDLHVYVDKCVFDRSNFSMMAWEGAGNNDVYITNCLFRNMIEKPCTQQWAGRGLSWWKDQDSLVVENNTFMNINFVPFQIENGAAKYVRFNHNTLINVGRQIASSSGAWWREAYFTNLLLINVSWHGEGYCDYSRSFAPGRDPRAKTTGMFTVATMPSKYGTDFGRRIVFANAAAYLDDYFKTKYADTVRIQPFTNAVTDSFFNSFSPANHGQMVLKDTSWLSKYPSFASSPLTPSLIQAMYNHITASRGYQYYGTGIQAKPYFINLPTDPVTGDTLWTSPTWPIPENFSYTDASLQTAGTDGLPLGDLNWFPNAKTTFEANKDQYVAQIEAMGGDRIVDNVALEAQAETGTLSGGATVLPFTGPAWYTTAGGCDIKWTFDAAAAGPVDMEITANLNGQNIGADLLLNGGHLLDILNWGQFVFWGGPDQPTNLWSGKPTGWYTVKYTQADMGASSVPLAVVAGSNTLDLGYSWNPVNVKEIKFYAAGTSTVIADLTASNAVNTGGIPNGEGKWVPEGFNSVKLGTNGSASYNIDLSDAGNYLLRIFYQNPGVAQSGSVSLDGTQVSTIDFASKPDSTGTDGLSGLFAATKGAHTLKITGSGANIDKWQLVQRTVITDVKDNRLPTGFALEQNYPNPFNPMTKIRYSIPKESKVSLKVYDILGRVVASLIDYRQSAGQYEVNFDASKYASGVYIYRIIAGDFVQAKKMILIK